jgi:DHA2 family multidrug resistance protein
VQQSVLVISDQYLILAGLSVFVLFLLMILPIRTYPPRIALVKPVAVVVQPKGD